MFVVRFLRRREIPKLQAFKMRNVSSLALNRSAQTAAERFDIAIHRPPSNAQTFKSLNTQRSKVSTLPQSNNPRSRSQRLKVSTSQGLNVSRSQRLKVSTFQGQRLNVSTSQGLNVSRSQRLKVSDDQQAQKTRRSIAAGSEQSASSATSTAIGDAAFGPTNRRARLWPILQQRRAARRDSWRL
jgi:hypothetical protein